MLAFCVVYSEASLQWSHVIQCGRVLGETPHCHYELNFEFLIFEHSEIFDCSRVFVTSSMETMERAKRRHSLEGCAIRALHWGPDWILTIPPNTSEAGILPSQFYQERDPRLSDTEKCVKVTWQEVTEWDSSPGRLTPEPVAYPLCCF